MSSRFWIFTATVKFRLLIVYKISIALKVFWWALLNISNIFRFHSFISPWGDRPTERGLDTTSLPLLIVNYKVFVQSVSCWCSVPRGPPYLLWLHQFIVISLRVPAYWTISMSWEIGPILRYWTGLVPVYIFSTFLSLVVLLMSDSFSLKDNRLICTENILPAYKHISACYRVDVTVDTLQFVERLDLWKSFWRWYNNNNNNSFISLK